CQEWMQRQQPRWTEKHAFDVRRALENHVLPDLGHLPIADIDRQEVLSVLRVMEGQGKHEAAHRARQRIEAVFNFAIITGDCETNPATGLTKALTPPVKKKMAALKPEELPEFLRRLEDYQGHRLTYLGMRFVIYTFVRTSELRLAEWKEFELKSANPVWTIPAERMKMRREHLVPLSKQAIQILQQVAEISGGESLVFPSQNNPNKPMSENTLLFAIYRMGYHSRATTHGFRSVASTILNESEKWHPDAIERQLAHVESNKVRAAYDRAEHLPERRRMMQWWAEHIDSLKQPAVVTDLEQHRA
ncbi:MAG: tyrosine-type recombinase/integrase, partial [SAR324 cluster bacterium]|nr:tyrosine-type recombinase/integrase [SAR324 cluster bacterium]